MASSAVVTRVLAIAVLGIATISVACTNSASPTPTPEEPTATVVPPTPSPTSTPTATPVPSPTPTATPTATPSPTPSPTPVPRFRKVQFPIYPSLTCQKDFNDLTSYVQQYIRASWPTVRMMNVVFDGEFGQHLFIAADLDGYSAPPDNAIPVWHILFDQHSGAFRSDFQSVNFAARDWSFFDQYDGPENLTNMQGFQLVQDCVAAELAGDPPPTVGGTDF